MGGEKDTLVGAERGKELRQRSSVFYFYLFLKYWGVCVRERDRKREQEKSRLACGMWSWSLQEETGLAVTGT